MRPATGGSATGGDAVHDSRADVVRAYAPYAIIIAVFTLANLSPVKDALAEKPWTESFTGPASTS